MPIIWDYIDKVKVLDQLENEQWTSLTGYLDEGGDGDVEDMDNAVATLARLAAIRTELIGRPIRQ